MFVWFIYFSLVRTLLSSIIFLLCRYILQMPDEYVKILPAIIPQSSWLWGVAAVWTGCECRCGAFLCRARRRWGPGPCSRATLLDARAALTVSCPGTHTAGTNGSHLELLQQSPPQSRWSMCCWCSRCWGPRWLCGEIIIVITEDGIYMVINDSVSQQAVQVAFRTLFYTVTWLCVGPMVVLVMYTPHYDAFDVLFCSLNLIHLFPDFIL